MTSEPTRDPVTDHLLSPQNCALVVIDYQPTQLQVMTSMDREVLVDNIVSVARLARTYDLPVVLSTVNAASGQGNTLPEIKAALPDTPEIDRTTMNAWEDVEFRQAVEATGRKKLIFAGISLEVCAAFPATTAVGKGLDAYVAVDASGTFSETKRQAGLLRMQQAGVILSDYATLMVEILKDNGRPEAGAVYEAMDMPWAKLVGQIAHAYGK